MVWVLIALGAVWGALLLGSLCPGWREGQHAALRLASSGVLVLAAWGWVAAAAGQAWTAYALPIAVGMSFGFVGDLFMAKVLPVRDSTLAGMGAFALNHAAYWVGFILLVAVLGIAWWPWMALALAAWMLVGTLVWRMTAGATAGSMRWPALVYTLLLAGTAGLGLGLALAAPRLALLAVGGALFLISDALIALRLFRGLEHPRLSDAIWMTYGPGQMLIVYGLAAGIASAPGG